MKRKKINPKGLLQLIGIYLIYTCISFTAILVLCTALIEIVGLFSSSADKDLYYSRIQPDWTIGYALLFGAITFMYACVFGRLKIDKFLYTKKD